MISQCLSTEEDTLCKLKLLGRIQKNDKINVRTCEILQNGWIASFSRFMKGETRELTTAFTQSTLDQALQLLEKYRSENRQNDLAILLKDIATASNGVRNLQATYSDDHKTYCAFERLLEKLVICLPRDAKVQLEKAGFDSKLISLSTDST